jgi:hypothetical protein
LGRLIRLIEDLLAPGRGSFLIHLVANPSCILRLMERAEASSASVQARLAKRALSRGVRVMDSG